MGRSSWQENYGGECYTITCLVWSSESTNLPAHAWFTWCDHGYFVEITVNIHASLTCIMTAVGINTIPSMDVIYAIFGTLLMLNCSFCVLAAHSIQGVLCQTPDEGFPYAT
ncbi:uncharacterized protein LOC130766222 isoform X3 [Actinidia eriantha]|uniref:uncharacterized protein LOC130766222 isoform X3 n=1 Tax=Actinidia eriantha TaxID=165200 RepID=UPI0025862CAB|nr:uncharacterized protein LOC130766222 isoform X3 [Actinidia eriantha]